MIKDPPLLTVRRNFPRPSEAVLRALRNVPTGFIVDCMNGRGALDYLIKPLDPYNCKFVAPVVTCHPGPGDNLAVFAALEIAQRGDAIFIATDTFTKTAVAGDNMMAMGRNRGVVGFGHRRPDARHRWDIARWFARLLPGHYAQLLYPQWARHGRDAGGHGRDLRGCW